MTTPTVTPYIVDDFVYKSTLSALYNFSQEWIADLGAPDKETHNPYNKHSVSFLFYRPRVEALALARPTAYEHMVTLRMQRLPAERAQLINATLTRAEDATVRQEADLPSWDKLIYQMYVTAAHNDWTTTHDDILTRARTHFTNYLTLINSLRNEPGAGIAWLLIRQQADQLTDELLTLHYDAWRRRPIPSTAHITQDTGANA